MQDRSRLLIQVCETIVDPQTRKREVAALSQAMTELELQSGLIVTRNSEETSKIDAGTIEVVPVWRFLLELPE